MLDTVFSLAGLGDLPSGARTALIIMVVPLVLVMLHAVSVIRRTMQENEIAPSLEENSQGGDTA